MRQVILDTETTGLETSQGHRIIEIGCIEVINRRVTNNHWHQYINPERAVDAGAFNVHGISDEFLQDKPLFSVLVEDLISYLEGAELVIHNAPFDVGFLNYELAKLDSSYHSLGHYCTVLDTLTLARQKHPGQKNNLDALCKRYDIDNSSRTLHGALLDAEILAEVYLAMTGGQTMLSLDHNIESGQNREFVEDEKIKLDTSGLGVWEVDPISESQHQQYLNLLKKNSGCNLWQAKTSSKEV